MEILYLLERGNNMLQNFINGLYDFHFLQNALITSVVIGIVSGTVGCFSILRGMSLMVDAISHAGFARSSNFLYFRH